MGETGCGLIDASEIISDIPLARTWKEIQEVCPWFFVMRDLSNTGGFQGPRQLQEAYWGPDRPPNVT
jgi:hypothetical protein